MTNLIEQLSKEISSRERIRRHVSANNPFHVPQKILQQMAIGEFPLGRLVSKSGVSEARLIRGLDTRLMYIIGMPGQGKTNLLRMLALYAVHVGDKNIMISRKGWEFTPLLNAHKEFYDLKTQDIRMNPFTPPLSSISQKEWNQKIAGALAAEGWLVYASATNLEKLLDEFTEKSPGTVMTATKLVDYIKKRKSYKLIQVDEKVANRLEAQSSGLGKQVFDTNENISFDFYAKNSLNFDLEAFSGNQIGYFIASFLAKLVEWKIQTNAKEYHRIILDDYSDLSAEQNDSMPRMNELVKTILVYGRKLKIDLWLVAQSAFNTSKYVLDNATTIIRFKTGGISDKALEQVIEMSEKEREILARCPTGFSAVQRNLVYRKPVLVATPLFPMREMSEAERDAIMKSRLERMRAEHLTVIEDKTIQENQPSEYDLKIDEQVEKFVEMKQKLTYFLITASVAVIAFTVNFLAEHKLESEGIVWIAILSAIAGLLTAGFSLLSLRYELQSYRQHLKSRYERKGFESVIVMEQEKWERLNRRAAFFQKNAFVFLFLELALAVVFFVAFFE